MDNNRQSHGRLHRKTSLGQEILDKRRMSAPPGTFMKTLEFPADGPGRVIVRLERLMGSDRIRITDTKYMATLLQRLQEEEEITWRKRTRERRKAEHNRFRQLVIDGYTEPTPDMQDLLNHPVFRVNRILNRLNRLNNAVTPTASLPPIVPVEPFIYDESGRVFKSYPGHFPFADRTELQKLESSTNLLEILSYASLADEEEMQHPHPHHHLNISGVPEIFTLGDEVAIFEPDENEGDDDEEEEGMEGEFYSKLPTTKFDAANTDTLAISHRPSGTSATAVHKQQPHKLSTSLAYQQKHKLSASTGPAAHSILAGSHDGKQQHTHIAFSSTNSTAETLSGSNPSSKDKDVEDERTKSPEKVTLQEIQQRYGIVPNVDLGVQWKPYQSDIVEKLFYDEKRRGVDLYKLGAQIVGVYDREQQTTNDYIAALLREDREKAERSRVITGEAEDKIWTEELEFDRGNGDALTFAEIEEYDGDEEDVSLKTEVPVSPTWEDLEAQFWEEEEETDNGDEEEEEEDVE